MNSGVAPQNVSRLLGHKDGATTLKLYAHFLAPETIQQLDILEKKHRELHTLMDQDIESIISGNATKKESSMADQIEKAIQEVKFYSPSKGAENVLQVCNEILVKQYNKLSEAEKLTLLYTMRQYTILMNEDTTPTRTKSDIVHVKG